MSDLTDSTVLYESHLFKMQTLVEFYKFLMIPHIDEEMRKTIERYIEGGYISSTEIKRPKEGYMVLYKNFAKDDYRNAISSPFHTERHECTDCEEKCQIICCMDCSIFKCQKKMIIHLPFYTLDPIYICDHCTAMTLFHTHNDKQLNSLPDNYTKFFFCVEELNTLLEFHSKLANAISVYETHAYLLDNITLNNINNKLNNSAKRESKFSFAKCCYKINKIFIQGTQLKQKANINNKKIWDKLILEPYQAYLGYVKEHMEMEKAKTFKMFYEERILYNKTILQLNKAYKKWEQFEETMDELREKICGNKRYRNDSFDPFINERFEKCKGKFIDMNNFDNDAIVKRYFNNKEKKAFKKQVDEVFEEFRNYLKLEEEYNEFVSMGDTADNLIMHEEKQAGFNITFDKFDSFNYKSLFSCREAEKCYLKSAELFSDFIELFYQLEQNKLNIECDSFIQASSVLSGNEAHSKDEEEAVTEEDEVSLLVEFNVNLDELENGNMEDWTGDLKIKNFSKIQNKLNNLNI